MTGETLETGLVVRSGGALGRSLPPFVRDAGPEAFTAEFFAARIPNPNTRAAYENAVRRFCAWCEAHGIALAQVNPVAAADYIQALGQKLQTRASTCTSRRSGSGSTGSRSGASPVPIRSPR